MVDHALPQARPNPQAAPLPWPALREELRIDAAGHNRDGSPAWHIADPVRNMFFRIGWLEFEMIRRWALGSPAAVARSIAAETALAPETEDVAQFVQFVRQHSLVQEGRLRTRPPLWRWLLDNYLFIRIPLVRPAHWLRRIEPWTRWLFGRGFLLLTAAAGLVGLVLAARQWDTVLSSLRSVASWNGAAGFAIALAVSKLLHELGHAMAATRRGVRVGHMGVALLVLWPMAYTDTGESWKLRRSRDRLAIASAGIMAELVLAAWATLLWAFVPEGGVKQGLFFLATTAWVLTLAINASPFMRFDGYFILADLIDFPGLHERAGQWAKRFLRGAIAGLRDPAPEALRLRDRRLLVGFAFATWAYRLVLFIGIAVVVYHAFFKALGVFLFVVEIMVFVVRPIAAELSIWRARRAEVPRQRLWLGAALLGFGALVLFVPWSRHVSAPGVLRAGFEQPVYSPYAARLERIGLRDGQAVSVGDVLAELDAPEQAEARARAQALSDAYARSARSAVGFDADAAEKEAMARQFANRYQAEQTAREAELQRLRLTAQGAGILRDIDPTLHPGTWVRASTPVAVLVGGDRWRVEALVAERDRQRIVQGMAATVIVRGHFDKRAGRVSAIDDSPVKRLPHLLLAQPHGGPVALNPTVPAAQLQPVQAWYRVLVDGEGPVPAIREVVVHFDGESESIARRWSAAAVSVLIQQTGF